VNVVAGDDVQQEILQRLTRVETKLDMFASARDIATEALQSAKNAHHRVERVEKIIYWLGTTVIGAILVAVVTFVMKGGLA
jgi:tetrahydromethanopterin S-methyltransferase subunit G